MEGITNQGVGSFEAQGQPPYQPPPGQGGYGPPPGGPGYGPPPGQPGYGPPPGPSMGPPPSARSAKPLIAGILLIIVAIEAFITGGVLATGASLMGAMSDLPGMEALETILLICGIIFIIFGILILVGGLSAIARKSWGLALLGSIIGLLSIGMYFTGTLLSIIALILIAISKNEF